MKPTILIAGATGATGSVATEVLLEKGFPVRALVHAEDERSQKLKAQGVEIALGDYQDFRSLQRAFKGVQRAYFVYPILPGIVQATVHFAQAALEAKSAAPAVEGIVRSLDTGPANGWRRSLPQCRTSLYGRGQTLHSHRNTSDI